MVNSLNEWTASVISYRVPIGTPLVILEGPAAENYAPRAGKAFSFKMEGLL
jgi:hypothetical protein